MHDVSSRYRDALRLAVTELAVRRPGYLEMSEVVRSADRASAIRETEEAIRSEADALARAIGERVPPIAFYLRSADLRRLTETSVLLDRLLDEDVNLTALDGPTAETVGISWFVFGATMCRTSKLTRGLDALEDALKCTRDDTLRAAISFEMGTALVSLAEQRRPDDARPYLERAKTELTKTVQFAATDLDARLLLVAVCETLAGAQMALRVPRRKKLVLEALALLRDADPNTTTVLGTGTLVARADRAPAIATTVGRLTNLAKELDALPWWIRLLG